MYSEATGTRKTLGDVDVIYHEGLYHLFHLVLPNHDFIAHAVSNNCLQWRRVENAIFLGHPGSWDDSMLWTIHVSPHPNRPGTWRMFYTGISRRDHGLKQRIGVAESDNLYCWRKSPVRWEDRRSKLPYPLPGRPPQPSFAYDANSCFPLSPDSRYYESELDEGRHWVSFRDPYYFRENDRGYLLAAARVGEGPVTRRGCVALLEETRPDHFEFRAPLHHPGLYDDIEVPNLIRIEDEYYLIGSMREDAKIRYWHTRSLNHSWRSYADNVLLAAGNYAGRVCHDDKGILLWSFFTPTGLDRLSDNLMPPPKRIVRSDSGRLEVKTFEGFENEIETASQPTKLEPLRNLPGSSAQPVENRMTLTSEYGFEIYAIDEVYDCFRVQAHLKMLDEGKTGLVFRLDPETQSGYFLSLDLFKGVGQLRSWGCDGDGRGEEVMKFSGLQAGYWEQVSRGQTSLTVLAYGSYLEVSIDGRVILSLANQEYQSGRLGFYVESAKLRVTDLRIDRLRTPRQTDDQLANG